MFLVLKTTLKGYRLSLGLMGLALLGLGVLIPTTFTTFGSDANALLREMPQGLQAILKTQGDLLPMLGVEGYVAVGYRHPFYLIVTSAFTIAAASALAREIEKGTIFAVLARPFPRYHLVLAKTGALVVGVVILLSATLVGTALGSAIGGLGDSLRMGLFLLVTTNALLLFLAIGGYSTLLSSMSREGSTAISLATGVTVAFFLMDFVASLWEPLELLGPWTVFHYYDPMGVVQAGGVPIGHALALGAVAAVSFGAALWVFQRRDIP